MPTLRDDDIARWRLRSQGLNGGAWSDGAATVAGLLAVQAENASQASWAVATRSSDGDRGRLAGLLDDGTLIRTHVLRPTWHFVHADDLGWLLELTGPKVRKLTATQLKNLHGLEGPALQTIATRVLEALTGESLTRDDLAGRLRAEGVAATGNLMMLLMATLELDGLVCSGPVRHGVHTYALLEHRTPGMRRLDRAEALAEIARRYFTGHGPATERDLAYWATLTLTDVRTGIAAAEGLASLAHDGRTYWHAAGETAPTRPKGQTRLRGHLLQILDETYRGYQDSRYVLDTARIVPRGREDAIGMGLVDGQLLTRMKRTVTPSEVRFTLLPHRPLAEDEVAALHDAAERYAAWLGLAPRLEVAGG